jgi:hypothetical protein
MRSSQRFPLGKIRERSLTVIDKNKDGEVFKICGEFVSKRVRKRIILLINFTCAKYGVVPKKIKSAEAFWQAITPITGLAPEGDENFSAAADRVSRIICGMSKSDRRELINKVDAKSFYEMMGISTRSTFVTTKMKDDFYKSWAWRTLRMEVLIEQGRRCQCCGSTPLMQDSSGQPVRITVDHIQPISIRWELRLQKKNLQVLCDECNQGKGNWDQSDFRPGIS